MTHITPSINTTSFGGAVHVGNSEHRALFTWFKNIKFSALPALAKKHGGRYLVINGGRL